MIRKPSLRSRLLDGLLFVLVLSATAAFLFGGENASGYPWQWYRIPRYLLERSEERWRWGPLMQGMGMTLALSGISLILSWAVGITAALMRLSHSIVAAAISRGYTEFIRNTPLLVQLFFIYFVLGPIFDIPKTTAAVTALSIFEGAYVGEIIRSGITSIDKTQWESAYSLGMNLSQTYRWIILPQAIRRVLPPLTSQTVSLVKDSSLVSAIAVADLTLQGQIIIADTFLTFEIWFTVAAMYLIVTTFLSVAASRLEARMDRSLRR
ncbi:MAG: amino acid ABC transporter permease [Thermodesulfobacteriota bacterium]